MCVCVCVCVFTCALVIASADVADGFGEDQRHLFIKWSNWSRVSQTSGERHLQLTWDKHVHSEGSTRDRSVNQSRSI